MKRTIIALILALSLFAGVGFAVAQSDLPTPTADTITPVPIATAGDVVVVEQPPVVVPDPSPAPSPTDGAGAALVLVLALVGALNRFVELVKPTIKGLGLSDTAYDAAVVAVSVALGIVMVLLSNQQLNLLAGLPLVPPLIGTILTGAAAGFGAGAVQAVFDLVYGWSSVVTSTTSKTTTYTSPDVKTPLT
jgi:hypothetical protein